MSKNVLLLCLLPVLLLGCGLPQGSESGKGGSTAADEAFKALANEPGTFLKQSFALLFYSPPTNEDGLLGRFPENYKDPKEDFSLWMPKKMDGRLGDFSEVQQRIDDCVSGRLRGTRYEHQKGDAHKQLDENTQLYAHYYRYYVDELLSFGRLEDEMVTMCYITVFNMTVNEEGLITSCSYMRFTE